MSHGLFVHSIFSNARVWAFLKLVDAAAAKACRSARCPHCGGELHCATYPRKPRGLAPALRGDARRFGFCCADCRRRVTPPSSRFFGRRFRVAPLFAVASAVVLSGGARLEAIGRQWGIPALTLRRWRRCGGRASRPRGCGAGSAPSWRLRPGKRRSSGCCDAFAGSARARGCYGV